MEMIQKWMKHSQLQKQFLKSKLNQSLQHSELNKEHRYNDQNVKLHFALSALFLVLQERAVFQCKRSVLWVEHLAEVAAQVLAINLVPIQYNQYCSIIFSRLNYSKYWLVQYFMENGKDIRVYNRAVMTGAEGSVIQTILDACMDISAFLRHSPVIKLETFNLFGDEQLHQDVECDGIIEKHLRLNSLVKGFASEEKPYYQACGEGEGYVVTYDPLDGSSIVGTNFAIGSIFSIWKTGPANLVGAKIRDQVNAVICIFGPRTTAVYYNPTEDKVQEVTAIDDYWIISYDHLTIKEKTNIFSPGNLRSASENEQYQAAVMEWIKKGYTLRYTGGLAVDVYQIFIKGHGVFSNCGSAKFKCKLRALYEAAALGYLIDKAGGSTITVGKGSLLDYEIKGYDDTLSFALGSSQEIEFLKHLF